MSDETVSSLLAAAAGLARELGHAGDDEQARRTGERLLNCVLRPLRQAAGAGQTAAGTAAPAPVRAGRRVPSLLPKTPRWAWPTRCGIWPGPRRRCGSAARR